MSNVIEKEMPGNRLEVIDKMHYQDINELLAKGIKVGNMPSDYAEAVTCANEYLISRKGKKPDWLDDFLAVSYTHLTLPTTHQV